MAWLSNDSINSLVERQKPSGRRSENRSKGGGRGGVDCEIRTIELSDKSFHESRTVAKKETSVRWLSRQRRLERQGRIHLEYEPR